MELIEKGGLGITGAKPGIYVQRPSTLSDNDSIKVKDPPPKKKEKKSMTFPKRSPLNPNL